jgi:hypothetical protein
MVRNVLSSLFQSAGTDWAHVVFDSSRALSDDFSQPMLAISAMLTASASRNFRMRVGNDFTMKGSKRIGCQARSSAGLDAARRAQIRMAHDFL